MKGLFITFEGIEGSGKTTQIQALARALSGSAEVVLTREPGGTPLADAIRETLLAQKSVGMAPATELLLYELARRDHVEEVVRPALKRGAVVLCDRFTDATVAYQGYARGLPLRKIEWLNRIATGGLRPDRTFLFDLPVATGLRRAETRKKKLDRFDRESQTFHEKVRRGYLALARNDKKRFRILHADRPRDIIFREIHREVEKLLQARARPAAGRSRGVGQKGRGGGRRARRP
ncbi:MAG TPA: dTMP kinase [bacterium]|nr:dTMP kinase [bacterium]